MAAKVGRGNARLKVAHLASVKNDLPGIDSGLGLVAQD